MDAADAESLHQWLATLSGPDLDVLISLRDFAVTRAKNLGHPHLAHRFHLRTLRALGVVLLECFKQRLTETSVDPAIFDRLARLSDSDADYTKIGGDDSKVVKPNEDQQTSIGAKEKTKSDARCHDEVTQCQKKRKTSCGDIAVSKCTPKCSTTLKNGNRDTTEEQAEQPLSGPLDAPEEAASNNDSSTREIEGDG